MKIYKIVTLAVIGLFLSVSFIASSVMAAEKDGVMMKDGKMVRMTEGAEIGPIHREMTMSNGTKVTLKGKIVTKDGKEMQMTEGQMVMLDGKITGGDKGKMSDKDMPCDKGMTSDTAMMMGDKHAAEALEHAKQAVAHGKEGHADALVEHAREALKHAEASNVKSPHLVEGIMHLKEAENHGLAPHVDVATEHAEGAVIHLSEVK